MDRIKKTKLFVGPMSKNIVETVINFSNNEKKYIGFIPSRRQVEYDGGYVNKWTTEQFHNFIKNKSDYILTERDHGGPGQGLYMDDGLESYKTDSNFFNIIHIDPWKKYPNYEEGLKETIQNLRFCYLLNSELYFEIATEEAIRPFSVEELDKFLNDLKNKLEPELYNRIVFVVIQSGTSLKNLVNTGSYKNNKLKEMIKIVKKYGKLSKEHNGDWMKDEDFISRFKNGLDGLNIAPELGTIETQVILDELQKLDRNDLIDKFYEICYNSGKWKKWVSHNFIPKENKIKLIQICGHYVFSNQDFQDIKKQLNNIDILIQKKLYEQFNLWFSFIQE